MMHIKSPKEIELIRQSGDLAARTLVYIEQFLKPGISTQELNDLCHQFILKHGAIPAPLNYHGFPRSICTSRNEVVCHGIPNEKEKLKDGDIINIDVTTILNGMHGDVNKTFLIGNVPEAIKKLVKVTEQCLMESIKVVRPGARLGDIGACIQDIAHAQGYSVVRDFCGHGIGRNFHEEPQILHFGKKGSGAEMKEGMTFTIEPMINLGTHRCKVLSDGWTAVTLDGKCSAQFEHTIAVVAGGADILTLPLSAVEKI